jgi:hypothetical protein
MLCCRLFVEVMTSTSVFANVCKVVVVECKIFKTVYFSPRCSSVHSKVMSTPARFGFAHV